MCQTSDRFCHLCFPYSAPKIVRHTHCQVLAQLMLSILVIKHDNSPITKVRQRITVRIGRFMVSIPVMLWARFSDPTSQHHISSHSTQLGEVFNVENEILGYLLNVFIAQNKNSWLRHRNCISSLILLLKKNWKLKINSTI